MLEDADRIDGMLKELVTFSHIDELPVSLVDTDQLIREVVRRLQQEFQSTGVVVVGETDVGNTCIRADRALFAQVLRILIVNGIEASPPGGRVTVRVSVSGAMVMIKVTDNGPGIPADRLPRLFELFYTTKPSGMGIGLALARRAVERFGGNIQAKSVPGQGATFIIEMRGC
jgi:signal transduction histidine kinase